MRTRLSRAIALLSEDQPIYYTGGHTGHVLTYEQGKHDAHTWSDYINVGMEHGCFDMTGLAEYMRGLVDGGPTLRRFRPRAQGRATKVMKKTSHITVRLATR